MHIIPCGVFQNIIELDKVESTNGYLKTNSHLPSGTVAITLNQTAGKGRRGHTWDSKGALCMSFLLKELELRLRPFMSLIAGLAVCDALGDFCKIKWPNDIMAGEKKLCGILCENIFIGDKTNLICGIGINVSQTKEDFQSKNLPFATSVHIETSESPEFGKLASQVIKSFHKRLLWAGENPEDIVHACEKKCVTIGRDIDVIFEDKRLSGKAVGIAPDGGLLVETAGKQVTVYAGEVSIRSVQPRT